MARRFRAPRASEARPVWDRLRELLDSEAASQLQPKDKLAEALGYADEPRMKLFSDKLIYPGRKQAFRRTENYRMAGDTLARWYESLPGEPLLRRVLQRGERLGAGREPLDAIRDRARRKRFGRP